MAAAGTSPTYITIQASDGTRIEVPRRAAERSGLLRELLAEMPHLTKTDVVPVHGCDPLPLRAVLSWCEIHHDDPDQDENTAAKPRLDWDQEFLRGYPVSSLHRIAEVASRLRVNQLREDCVRAIANKFVGARTPRAVRKAAADNPDALKYTPDDSVQVRHENDWEDDVPESAYWKRTGKLPKRLRSKPKTKRSRTCPCLDCKCG